MRIWYHLYWYSPNLNSTATDSLGLVEWLCWGQNLVILSGGNLVSCAWRSTARCRGGACRFDVFVLGIMMHIFSLMSASKVVCLVWARQILESIIARFHIGHHLILQALLQTYKEASLVTSEDTGAFCFWRQNRKGGVISNKRGHVFTMNELHHESHKHEYYGQRVLQKGTLPSKWTAEAATTTRLPWLGGLAQQVTVGKCRQPARAMAAMHSWSPTVSRSWIGSALHDFVTKALAFPKPFLVLCGAGADQVPFAFPNGGWWGKWWERCRRCL